MEPDATDDIHPLDRDYSQPASPAQPVCKAGREVHVMVRLRRVGIGVLCAGFVTVVLVGITLTNFSGPKMEAVGSQIHRIGMWGILVGGILFVLAYRLPRIVGPDFRGPSKKAWLSMLTVVLVVGAIAWLSKSGVFFGNVLYHRDVRSWNKQIHDGAVSWDEPGANRFSSESEYVEYWDWDNDGIIDARHEIRGEYFIRSRDEDHDGIFDTQTIETLGGMDSARPKSVAIPVPRS